MIPARPDDGLFDAVATPVTADGGRLDEAWEQIHKHGSWAELPKVPRDKQVEQRNRSAWMAYGIEPRVITLPGADPLTIRLRLKRFANTAADRRANIRLLVRDVTAADPRRSGIRAMRSRQRLSWQAKARPNDVQAAHNLVAHYNLMSQGIAKRFPQGSLVADAWGIFAICYMLSLFAMALAPTGPYFRVWQVAFAAMVAIVCAYHIGMTKGWKYGRNQSIWHCAEVATDHSYEAAQRSEEDIRRAREQAQQAAEDARTAASRRMAFRLPQQPRNEGYLYVLEFSTGSIKVGQTEDPKRRLGQHLSEARAFGVYVTNYWISPSCHNFKGNETRLINACNRISKERTRKEYFHDVAYDQAVQFANDLAYFSKDTSQTSVEGVWA